MPENAASCTPLMGDQRGGSGGSGGTGGIRGGCGTWTGRDGSCTGGGGRGSFGSFGSCSAGSGAACVDVAPSAFCVEEAGGFALGFGRLGRAGRWAAARVAIGVAGWCTCLACLVSGTAGWYLGAGFAIATAPLAIAPATTSAVAPFRTASPPSATTPVATAPPPPPPPIPSAPAIWAGNGAVPS